MVKGSNGDTKLKGIVLKEHELKNLRWWCRHHKENVAYLTLRMYQILNSNDENRKSLEGIMRATVEEFAKSADLDLEFYKERMKEQGTMK